MRGPRIYEETKGLWPVGRGMPRPAGGTGRQWLPHSTYKRWEATPRRVGESCRLKPCNGRLGGKAVWGSELACAPLIPAFWACQALRLRLAGTW